MEGADNKNNWAKLIETDELQKLIDDKCPNLRIINATLYASDFYPEPKGDPDEIHNSIAGHIPGYLTHESNFLEHCTLI
jgi:hypothetical protein